MIKVQSPRVEHFNGVSAVYAETLDGEKIKIAHGQNSNPFNLQAIPQDCRVNPEKITAIIGGFQNKSTFLTVQSSNGIQKYQVSEQPQVVRDFLKTANINAEPTTPARNCHGRTPQPLPQIKSGFFNRLFG